MDPVSSPLQLSALFKVQVGFTQFLQTQEIIMKGSSLRFMIL